MGEQFDRDRVTLDTAFEALAAWLDYLTHERRASPRTVRAYGDAVLAYLGFLEQHRGESLALSAMGEISAGDVRAYLAFRRSGDHPLAPRSVSQALSAIRAFHVWLDRRLNTPNPALALVRGPRLPRGVPRPVSEVQALELIEDAGADTDRADWEIARDEALLTLLWGCGLRISEASISLMGGVRLWPRPSASPARAARPGSCRCCRRCARRWTPIWRPCLEAQVRASRCFARCAAAPTARAMPRP